MKTRTLTFRGGKSLWQGGSPFIFNITDRNKSNMLLFLKVTAKYCFEKGWSWYITKVFISSQGPAAAKIIRSQRSKLTALVVKDVFFLSWVLNLNQYNVEFTVVDCKVMVVLDDDWTGLVAVLEDFWLIEDVNSNICINHTNKTMHTASAILVVR